MSDNHDIALEMSRIFEEEQLKFLEEEAGRAQKYRIAAVFLAVKMAQDLKRVHDNLLTTESKGSYSSKQKVIAKTAIEKQLVNTTNLIEFLKEAEQKYFLEGREIEGVLCQLAKYFENDQNELYLAKLSYEIVDASFLSARGQLQDCYPVKTISDVIAESLERSFPEAFK